MKKGFTIIEVSILFVIFLIVALLVAPMSLDDTVQAKNTSRWRTVQADFENIFYSINSLKEENSEDFILEQAFHKFMSTELKEETPTYKITYLNGTFPSSTYRFNNYKKTLGNAVIATKFFAKTQDNIKGLLMYDVNGSMGPNVWGKDVFGLNIYEDKFEPFCKNESISKQKQECSRHGSGLCCSNYYLIGGSFDD